MPSCSAWGKRSFKCTNIGKKFTVSWQRVNRNQLQQVASHTASVVEATPVKSRLKHGCRSYRQPKVNIKNPKISVNLSDCGTKIEN